MGTCVENFGDCAIIYDDRLVDHPDPALFDPRHWPDARLVPGQRSGGRSETLFVHHAGQDWVLRHYHRGGLVGRLLRDQLFWLGPERTRPFREWRLLAELTALGLPVPRPVAGCYRRHGLIYTADLITLRLPAVQPLSMRLAAGAVDQTLWRAVGACIGRFHAHGVWHADLSAHNLQVDEGGRIFLLDFDRGCRRKPGRGWRERNLARLHRSLRKIRRQDGVRFAGGDWQALLEAYAAGLKKS